MAVGLTWKTYVGVSTAAFAVAVGNALNEGYEKGQTEEETAERIAAVLLASKICTFLMVNMAFCCLFVSGKIVQKLFFGRLRETETQHMYDRMLNYVLYKIIFVGAVLEPAAQHLVKWAAWFAILGFLKVFSQLSRDRFEYLMTSANNNMTEHKKLLVLLVSIMILDVAWFLFCLSSFQSPSYSVFFLLIFECFTLLLDTLQTVIKYAIHLARPDGGWANRGTYVYYTEFITDSLILTATLCHYCHILYMHGFSFTLIDAVLFLNMRIVFNNLREKITAYRNYRKLAHAMNVRFPNLSQEELDQLDDDCAICREPMTSAKRLPCKHVFHENCLRLWLEQHHSCPTCRCSLIDGDEELQVNLENAPGGGGMARDGNDQPRADQQPVFAALLGQGRQPAGAPPPNWLHWLPGLGQRQVTQQMIDQVQMVLPHAPTDIVTSDLQRTGSVELTIANIVEGRLEIPEPEQHHPEDDQVGPSAQSPAGVRPSSSVNVSQEEEVIPEPPKGFASTAEERRARLAARKAALLQQARQRMLEAQRNKEEEEEEQAALAMSMTQSSSTEDSSALQGTPSLSAPSSVIDTPSGIPEERTSTQPSVPPQEVSIQQSPKAESLEARRRKLALAAERRMRLSSSYSSSSSEQNVDV